MNEPISGIREICQRECHCGRVLICQEIKERTRAKDVFDLVNAFLREDSIP